MPTAYARDLQEDKEPLFDALRQTLNSLLVFEGVIRTLTVDEERMKNSLDPALYATDMADYLVYRGVPFRVAHGIVGKIVSGAEKEGLALNEVPLETLQSHSSLFEADVMDLFDPVSALKRRNISGGTGPDSVNEQLKTAKHLLGINISLTI